MRFIRKNGRVIPIQSGPGAVAKASAVAAKTGAITAAGGYTLHAAHMSVAKGTAAKAKIAARQFQAGDAAKFPLVVGLAKTAVVHHKEAMMGRAFGRVGLALTGAGATGLFGVGMANKRKARHG